MTTAGTAGAWGSQVCRERSSPDPHVISLVLHGWLLALAYLLAGSVACLLIVTIPLGLASFRLAGFAAWPFGRTNVRAPGAGVAPAPGNLLWFLFAGWWLALLLEPSDRR